LASHDWVKELPAGITVCDAAGLLIEMNEAAEQIFASDGGRGLLGSDVLDCHSGADRGKLERLIKERRSNAYVNEENGSLTFFFQSPWYQDGRYAGFVEISFTVPGEIPHHLRE
jgi:transcriptional regulator with PAS, ATPase and Fis domain